MEVEKCCLGPLETGKNNPNQWRITSIPIYLFYFRFVELHFNEIPPKELEFILHQRCQMAPSYAKKMINVMTELQVKIYTTNSLTITITFL